MAIQRMIASMQVRANVPLKVTRESLMCARFARNLISLEA
jgi:hypothetical protein